VLKCDSEGETKWFHKSMKSFPLSFTTSLTIPEVTWSHAGLYYCFGWSRYKLKKKSFIGQTMLYLQGKVWHELHITIEM